MNQTGVQTLAVSTVVLSLTMPTGNLQPSHAMIQNSGANAVRWRADGGTPSATVGQVLAAGATLQFMDPITNYEGMIRGFRVIRESADSTVQVAYFAV
jgi:hypothetical protein